MHHGMDPCPLSLHMRPDPHRSLMFENYLTNLIKMKLKRIRPTLTFVQPHIIPSIDFTSNTLCALCFIIVTPSQCDLTN